MGNQASKIQRETERWFERIKTGRIQRARMIKKQSQTEKQTIKEKDRWKLRPESEIEWDKKKNKKQNTERERKARISRFRIIKSERGKNIKQRSRVLERAKEKDRRTRKG